VKCDHREWELLDGEDTDCPLEQAVGEMCIEEGTLPTKAGRFRVQGFTGSLLEKFEKSVLWQGMNSGKLMVSRCHEWGSL
jgi:hypothetical protein